MRFSLNTSMGTLSSSKLEFGNVGEGKTGEPGEKRPGARARTNNKLNPHIKAKSGNQTWATMVGGECSHHCAIPASHETTQEKTQRHKPDINNSSYCRIDSKRSQVPSGYCHGLSLDRAKLALT